MFISNAANYFLVILDNSPVFQTDDTRCCINTIQPPDDEHIMLETCRWL